MVLGLLVPIELCLNAVEICGFVLEGAADFCLVGVDSVLLRVGDGLAKLGEVYAAFVEVVSALGHRFYLRI